MKNTPKKFFDAVLHAYPDATNLRIPNTVGSQNNLIFADIKNKTHAFKFGTPERLNKNESVSKLYRMRKIPCPDIKIRESDGLFFEDYEILDGITLFEAIENGMSDDKIKQIYREIIDCIDKMKRIPNIPLYTNKNKYVHQFAKEHITNTNGAILGRICMAAVYSANIGNQNDMALYHSDITPKNTIVSQDGHLLAFIDLDSVSISNINYIFGMMAAKYIELGFDIDELILYYEKISGKKLNRHHVSMIANSMFFIKKTLWKLSNNKQK